MAFVYVFASALYFPLESHHPGFGLLAPNSEYFLFFHAVPKYFLAFVALAVP